MKRRDLYIIGTIYALFNSFFFILYMFNYSNFLGEYLSYLLKNFGVNLNYFIVIIQNYNSPFGFLFIFVSVVYFIRMRIRKARILGYIGSIEYGIAIIMLIFVYNQTQNQLAMLYILIWIILIVFNLIILHLRKYGHFQLTIEEESKVRQIIIDLGTKYTRLEIREISEKCGIDYDSIAEILRRMIENNEIYAEFFETTYNVSFNQRSNIEEIDTLMAMYKSWEEEQLAKISNNRIIE